MPRKLFAEVKVRTDGYGFERTAWAVRSDSGDGIENHYINLATGSRTNSSTPARALWSGVTSAGETVMIEADYNNLKNAKRNVPSAPIRYYQPPSLHVRMMPVDPGGSRFNSQLNDPGGVKVGLVAGRVSFYGTRYDISAMSETSGGDKLLERSALSATPGYENRHEGYEYIDSAFLGAFDLVTKVGGGAKWTERSQQTSTTTVVGGFYSGSHNKSSKGEHCFYYSQLRGPHRFYSALYQYYGRTVTQLLSRATEDDGVAGTGSILHEDLICLDTCFDESSGSFSMRANHDGDVYYTGCLSSHGNDELSYKQYIDEEDGQLKRKKYRQSWQSNINGVNEYPRPTKIIRRMVLQETIALAGAAGALFVDDATLKLEGSCKEFRFEKCYVTGYNRDPVASFTMWDNGEANHNGQGNPNWGQRVVEKMYFDTRSVVIGKVLLSPDIGVEYGYADPLGNGAGYRAMLADPRVVNDSRFIIYDSEGGGGPETYYYSALIDSEPAVYGFYHLKKPSAGGSPPPESYNYSVRITAPKPVVSGSYSIIPPGLGGTVISEPLVTGNYTVIGGGGSDEFNFSVRITPFPPAVSATLELETNLSATIRASSIVSGSYSRQDPGGGGDGGGGTIETVPDQPINSLTELLPIGPAWNAKYCPGTVMHGLAAGTTEFLEEIYRSTDRLRPEQRSPRKAVSLFSEWLTELGLPRVCSGDFITPATLRNMAYGLWRLYGDGGYSPKKLRELLLIFGFDVVAIERTMQDVGNECGEVVCGDPVNARCSSGIPSAYFVVRANIDSVYMVCGDPDAVCGSPLGYTNDQGLRCFLESIKPAHAKFVIVPTDESECGLWRDGEDWRDEENWEHC